MFFLLRTLTEHLTLRFKALNRTLHRQHTQQTVIICLVHKVICRAVVSLQ